MINQKRSHIFYIIISSMAIIVLAILYTIETNKTITTPELIESLLIENDLENVNSEASIESLSALQDFIRSENFESSSNYLELKGNDTNYVVQFRYEENREIRILGIKEVAGS
ncbi:hypothetical protein [Alkalicoccobacillus plakortidis]|uniref:Small secreted protein n=1 Tax=Alkalicoccobacillus plakortidis TaxID=444060 RepID=A0ABT0XL50_9BACI|nr:hypothetical protein [Alkalicoccobacillus plakortidis]MCM2676616.1 hypothetical protein [Alkalicoccobacillus plakortidis]